MNARLAPPDKLLLGPVLLLMLFGAIMVASASVGVSEVRYGDPLRIIGHWLLYIPIGLGIIWLLSRIDVAWWKASTTPLLFGCGFLLMVVLIPGVGTELNGARRWFSIFGFTLQPVELFKPAIVLYMSFYMASFPERLKEFVSGLAPMLVVLAAADFLLLLQPDFGSAALISATCFCLWFVGGVPPRQLAALLVPALIGAALLLAFSEYRMARLTSFTDPWADAQGNGYQLAQSMIAFGAGGITGSGLGQSIQKLFYLPEAFTDFISAVIGEELGLFGTLTVILTFGVLIARGFYLCGRCHNPFRQLLVLGCTLLIAFTFTINLGAAMGLLPTKGMPMPFVSYGGSALIGNAILIGLLLSVQRHMGPMGEKQRRPEVAI